ncbi:probable LRR receptor-like serine/threonine-protein kinase At1g12460 isoform X1 [Cryptomeria japonica]|uniref:probable LRR receptor-like serine/threonine-protein kinase At1g12460 isoform X1 n=2 Tax=Cryptomeria japonica TaxID=3369 RepID=UPI0027DA1FA0|nr:probable LRR receptor-like serine/threonine-protein kinase At1g12460 isoform X1 [Cryptomeria japonica]XP_057850906.2 probable LRR receptor-like serine/threonine-protein kinase At1g12460 isoform X1 [Cryptomeria japonica]XP_057850907.2 probable LRR receptor-like serine/threonine-protein kinase At1g12460 isoform X1 [Cryptomeria japonica]
MIRLVPTMRPCGLNHRLSWWVILFVSSWIFSLFGVSNAAQQDEIIVLLDFKSEISDPLNVLQSWMSSDASPCGWTGITCDADGNVEKIILQDFHLNGTISPALTKLKQLRALSLSRNGFTGQIPVELAKIGSLWKLNLSHNAFSGPVPPDLGNLSSLRMLDLSGNFLSGAIPQPLFKYCNRLRYISLSNNSLSGPIPTEISQCGRLEGFDFSLNDLTGSLPTELGNCRSLRLVDLGGNSFSGSLPQVLLSFSNLSHLAVDGNSFTEGLLPDILTLQNLKHYNISHNRLSGKIPVITNCSSSLKEIDLSANNFTGEIPSSLTSCKSLTVLDLTNNKITGNIPSEIGNLAYLEVLRLGGNSINGSIPSEIGNIEFLQILDLHGLDLQGPIPAVLPNCRFLLELDLSDNTLDGHIPEKLYNITYLNLLDLHSNKIDGSIPSNIGTLSKMRYLDLSDNKLTGMIPPSLGNMVQLGYFNVSFNMLQGRIPNNPVMRRFGKVPFVRNAGLCGPPLDTICEGPASAPSPSLSGAKRTRLLSVSAIIAIVAAAVIAVGVCLITLINVRTLRRKKAELLVYESTPPSPDSNLIIGKLVLFSKSLPSKYEDWEAGTKALLDKKCLIGGGAIGTVYKASFDGGLTIAVKKLEILGRIKVQEEFEQEIGRLGNLRHPNLAALQGYYWSSTMQLILSDFIPNGNLYHHLHERHPGQSPLCWGRRFKIALGTAKALAYLHHDCKPPILHFDIKSTNILVDDDFEPHLSDYGLGKLLPMLDSYISASRKFHTAVGYVAPELACQSLSSSLLTEKCDVYSFGVILLELITGRRPVESPDSEVIILCEYVRSSLERGDGAACIDPNLLQQPDNEIMQVLKLGLICTAQTPSRRPSMAEVVQVLESIKPNLELQ